MKIFFVFHSINYFVSTQIQQSDYKAFFFRKTWNDFYIILIYGKTKYGTSYYLLFQLDPNDLITNNNIPESRFTEKD
jgi:hypothetical protein